MSEATNEILSKSFEIQFGENGVKHKVIMLSDAEMLASIIDDLDDEIIYLESEISYLKIQLQQK